jgi:predicted nucleic acid-binding protein
MIRTPSKVVLDANVLYPFTLRDTLLRAAAEGFFQVYWSERILDEASKNLVASGTMTGKQASRLRAAMANAFPESSVTGFESLISAMKNDAKDRHVVAVAVKAGAKVVVTANLKDFRDLPEGIEAESPDGFLGHRDGPAVAGYLVPSRHSMEVAMAGREKWAGRQRRWERSGLEASDTARQGFSVSTESAYDCDGSHGRHRACARSPTWITPVPTHGCDA